MPNWCSNDLIIEIPRAIAQPFIKKHIVDGEFDFNTIIPMPPHQPDLELPNPFWSDGPINHETQNQFPHNNWYDWSNKHWGTKWNANDTIYYSEEQELAIHFSTAWSPVPDVIQTLSSMYPTIRFHYSYNEPGMAFAGEMTFLDGDVLDR
jgi:hypothetical protein